MADSNVAITAGSGTLIDTQVPSGGDHRQVVVLGDPATVANVANVNASGESFVIENDQSNTFSIAANATSGGAVTLSGKSTAVIHVSSIPSATLQVQVTGDGTNWVNVTSSAAIVNVATSAFIASGNITSAGIYQIDVAGLAGVRVITTTFTTGPVTGTVRAGKGAGLVSIEGTVPISGSLTANQSVNVAQINGVTPLMGSGVNGTGASRVSLATDQAALSVAGVFSVKIDQTTQGTTNGIQMTNTTTTGNTLSSAATTNATSLKASAGNLYSVTASNTGAAAAYLKLYNKASAPTVGTDVPVLTISLPASGTVNVPFGTNGFRFATGIAYAITNLAADSDTTAVAAAQVKVMWSYI
jgi:hypothetical protein